jgi:hypothetical protein
MERALRLTYIEKSRVSSVEVLHIICYIAQYLNEKYRSLFVNIGQESQSMFEILEAWRSIIARPLIDRIHQAKCDHQKGLAVYEACFPVGEVRWLVVNKIKTFFKFFRVDQGEDGADIRILYPEKTLRKVKGRELG